MLSLSLFFFELGSIDLFISFDFHIFLMKFLVERIFPLNLSIHELFLQIVVLLLGLLGLLVIPLLQSFILLIQMFVLDGKLV